MWSIAFITFSFTSDDLMALILDKIEELGDR